MTTTKYLIPVEKPGQFDPIPITGEWVYCPAADRWTCRNAVPACYSDISINSKALKEDMKMTHEEMMQEAWEMIATCGITENEDEYKENSELYFVENIYQVRDAYYSDIENDVVEDEDVPGFLDRHGIEWK
jgi:hypothetical protein